MKVYFIGAGPGDPELLTVKAKRIIGKADIVIFAGSLVNRSILKFITKSAHAYDSSKMTLREVLGIMEKTRNSEKVIARVHSGDPSIYGAIQEQIAWCDKKSVPYEIIPGVSSFCAAAASLQQELTLPGISQTIILTRLSGRTKVPRKESLKALARIKATLVIFLSVDKINKVARDLRHGYGDTTPVAVVFRTSWPNEKIIRGTIRDITEKVKRERIDRQALIIVGEVLKKKDFRMSRLYDDNFAHSYRK